MQCSSLEARDEVITVLKAEMTDSALLEAHYGFRGPEKVLRALQRDSLQTKQDQLQDVYEEPMSEVPNTSNNKNLGHWLLFQESGYPEMSYSLMKVPSFQVRESVTVVSCCCSLITLQYRCCMFWIYSTTAVIIHL